MGLGSYTRDLPGAVKLLNKDITESRGNRNFRKKSIKEYTGVSFTKTQDKDKNKHFKIERDSPTDSTS